MFPALLLQYFGQGALVKAEPAVIEHLFFLMLPTWAVPPPLALATAATVIASQAVMPAGGRVRRRGDHKHGLHLHPVHRRRVAAVAVESLAPGV